MNRRNHLLLVLGWLATSAVAHADPIHAIGSGYWHHATGWVFPAKVAQFELVGVPQDVAGSDEAVAYYARVVDGARIVASISVCPVNSSLSDAAAAADKPARLIAEGTLASDLSGAPASRLIYESGGRRGLTALYALTTSEMRARIRFTEMPAEALPLMDAFVRALNWRVFTSAPIPR
jgi:hypothetical protein